MNGIKNTTYVYGSDFDCLQICEFYDLKSALFYFNDDKIYDQDKHEITQADFITYIKRYITAYKSKMQKFENYVIESEKIFEDKSLASTFSKKYHTKKYNLKKFSNILYDFYEAISLTVNEQPQLRKKLKPLAYNVKLFKNEISEFIARIDDINAHIKSLITDKITRNIYILTIMSALFLPLNLITGFFGMNTNKMFLADYQNSTLIVASIIAIIVIMFAVSWVFYQKKNDQI